MLKNADVKKNIELTVIGIGIIIFIFLIISYLPKSKGSKTASKTEHYPTSETAMMAVSEVESWDNVKWGKDPFLLEASSAEEQDMDNLSLNGIVSDKQNPYAIINNDVVKLGDKVGGMTIIEINENNVVLDENGQRHTLELNVY